MMNKKNIANKIYRQMLQDDHFYCENGFIQYSVTGTSAYNLPQTYTWEKRINLYESYKDNIKSILFDGIKKGYSPLQNLTAIRNLYWQEFWKMIDLSSIGLDLHKMNSI